MGEVFQKMYIFETSNIEQLENWIQNNAYIKESKTYRTGKYLKYIPSSIPTIDINNFEINRMNIEKLFSFFVFWRINSIPIEIYIILLNIDKNQLKKITEEYLLLGWEKQYITNINEMLGNKASLIAESNNLELLIYTLDNNIEFKLHDLVVSSIRYNSLNIVNYLVKNNMIPKEAYENAFTACGVSGNIELAEKFYENIYGNFIYDNTIIPKYYISYDISYSRLEHKYLNLILAYNNAVRNNQKNMIKYLKDKINNQLLEAIYYNRIDHVQYLMKKLGAEITPNKEYIKEILKSDRYDDMRNYLTPFYKKIYKSIKSIFK